MVEPEPLPPLPATATREQRDAQYSAVLARLEMLLQGAGSRMGASCQRGRLHACTRMLCVRFAGEDDWVAAMATVACELHRQFAYFHWTGFYRVMAPVAPAASDKAAAEGMLVIGPYQGGLGCLRIPFRCVGACPGCLPTGWRTSASSRGPTECSPPCMLSVRVSAARASQQGCVRRCGTEPADPAGASRARLPRPHRLRLHHPGTSPPSSTHLRCAPEPARAALTACSCRPACALLQSEVVVPVVTPQGRLLAVLDVDSGAHPASLQPACWSHLRSAPGHAAAGWAHDASPGRRPAGGLHRRGCGLAGGAVRAAGGTPVDDRAVM
jgi:putative methionine-R-sulfoxide reductase with GAF domain